MSRRALQLLWGLPAPPLCGEALRRAQLPLGQSGAAELCPALARGFFGLHAVRRFSTPAPASWGRHGPKGGPVSFKTLVLAMMAGAGVITAVKTYKDATLQQVLKRNDETVGKAAVGGPFSLIDQDGKPFSDRDLQGEFTLLYFGFTHCPDICPEELEKMSEAVDIVERMAGRRVRPLFISVDPQRDNPKKVCVPGMAVSKCTSSHNENDRRMSAHCAARMGSPALPCSLGCWRAQAHTRAPR